MRAFIRWQSAMESRTRPLHGTTPRPSDDFWDRVAPPGMELGMFNCRGEYVMPPPRRRPWQKPEVRRLAREECLADARS